MKGLRAVVRKIHWTSLPQVSSPVRRSETTLGCGQLTGRLSRARNRARIAQGIETRQMILDLKGAGRDHRTRQRLHPRLPRYLQPDRHGRRRPHHEGARLGRVALHRRRHLQQSRAPHRPTSCTGRSDCSHRCGASGPRGSGRFERISWEQALDKIHARVSEVIARHGPQAVMPLNYAGPHGMLAVRQHVVALLSQARRQPALSPRRMCGGVRSEAWAGTYGAVAGHRPRGGRERQAQRRVGQQRDGRQSASRAQDPPCEAQGRQARGDRPVAHQDRRAGRSAYARPRRARTCCSPSRSPPSWSGSARTTRVHRPSMCSAMTSSWRGRASGRSARAAAACGVHGERHRDARALDGRGRPAGHGARQRPRTRPQRRQRHPRRDRAAGADGQAAMRQRHRARRRQRFPKTLAKLQRPDLAPPGHAHAQYHGRRPASGRRRH